MKVCCLVLVLILLQILGGCRTVPPGGWSDPQTLVRYSEDVKFFVKLGTRIALEQTPVQPSQVEPLLQYFQAAKDLLLDPNGPGFAAARALALAQFADDGCCHVAVAVIDIVERYAASCQAGLGDKLGPLQTVLGAAMDGAIEALTEYRAGAK